MKIHLVRKLLIPLIGTCSCAIINFSCQKNNITSTPPPSNPVSTNKPPDQFSISLLGISSDTALVSWTQAIDPDNDLVTYKILLNDSVLASGYGGTTYTFKNLKELTTYHVKIIAVDSKQNETSETLSITTTKYWLRFLKKVEYGQISGYSSQKTGQMIKANDGSGYIIVGETELSEWPAGPFEMFTIKIDTLGNKIWQQFYNYSVGNNIEIKIVSNNADGYIICGGDNIIRISNTGDLIWRQSSGYSQLINATVNGIAVDGAGLIYAVGNTAGDSSVNQFEAILNEYDQSGNLILSRKYSPADDDYFYDIKINADNQVIVLGGSGTRSGQARDFWVLDLDRNGEIIWSNTYPDSVGYAFPENIIQTKEGNYVLTGFIFGPYDVPYSYLQMIDPNGNSLWTYFDPYNTTKSYSVSETSDNSLIVTGGYQLVDVIISSLYKFDKSGNKLWQKLYSEGEANLQDKTVIPTGDGGYIINCQKSKAYNEQGEVDQIYVFKTDDAGDF